MSNPFSPFTLHKVKAMKNRYGSVDLPLVATVEVVSFPFPVLQGRAKHIMVRTEPGNPASMQEWSLEALL